MRRIAFILAATATLCSADGVRLGVERSTNLGHGFHRDTIAEAIPPSAHWFESVGHFAYLFYRDRKLCAVGECAVAPSGDAIVYQDGPSGNIFVFRCAHGNITQLTEKFPGLARQFVWHEHEQTVAALVVRNSSAPESSGKWITWSIEPKT
jgi:hypothetical protein